MTKPLTPTQWDAVRTVDEHVLVDAGAGTGKTSTVIARVLYALGVPVNGRTCPSPLTLDQIAAITFTNRAAAELKERLREALRKAGRATDAGNVDGARIGTIHGFCADILRASALRAGRSPALRVVEEGEASAIASESVREAILEALENASIPGLEELIGDFTLKNVEEWVAVDLLREGDRLAAVSQAPVVGREGPLLALARAARAAMDVRLRTDDLIDFDRLIVWTRDLLRNDELAREHLRSRIRLLIVDEFQDVDPAQRDIAYALGDPLSRRTDTTRLMLVGDPKQSIYAFRRADVSVWTKVAREFAQPNVGRLVELDRNFRSVPAILAFVDQVIGGEMNTPVDGASLQDFEVPYRPLVAHDPQPDEASVELLLIPDTGEKIEWARAVEAETVALRMRELNRAGVAWRDMAILLTGWADADIYENALERAGIPRYKLLAEGYYERREVLDCILALRVARDPLDNVALMGFLRSPFVGLRDDTLLWIARAAAAPYWDHISKLDWRERSIADPTERALLAEAATLIRKAAALRDRVGIGDLLKMMLEDGGYVAHLTLFGADGLQSIANVRKFIRLADSSGEIGVGPFLKSVVELRERKDREGGERLFGAQEDVVTITSVHSAKGLEWEVVFWCDLMRGGFAPSGKLALGRDRAILGDPDLESDEQSPAWLALRAGQKAEADAERKRLWYVAATRAKRRLVLGGVPLYKPRGSDNPACIIRQRLGIDAVVPKKVTVTAADREVYRCAPTLCDPSLVPDDTSAVEKPTADADGLTLPTLPIPVRAGGVRHSATELMTYDRCPRRHWFKYIEGMREPEVRRDRGDPALVDAIRRGQIVHDVLEQLREEDELDTLLEDAIGRWDESAPPPETPRGGQYRAHLREEVELVAKHPEYRAIADRPGAQRELGFVHISPTGAVTGGAIDLAAPEADGFVLLDVKTSQVDAKGAQQSAASYARQRDVYVTSVEGISGRNVERFAFQFSRAGLHIAEPISETMREAARVGVALSEAQLGSEGLPPLTKYPKECGWCGYRRANWCPGASAPVDDE